MVHHRDIGSALAIEGDVSPEVPFDEVYRDRPVREHGLMVTPQIEPITQLALHGLPEAVERSAAHEVS
jgi:hypothetical protein